MGIVMMFISAGHNTTTSAIGNAALRLARDAELQALRTGRAGDDPRVRRGGGFASTLRSRRCAASRRPTRGSAGARFRPATSSGSSSGRPTSTPRCSSGQPSRPCLYAEPACRLRPRDPPVHRGASRPPRAPGRARASCSRRTSSFALDGEVALPAWPRGSASTGFPFAFRETRLVHAQRRALALVPALGRGRGAGRAAPGTAAGST